MWIVSQDRKSIFNADIAFAINRIMNSIAIRNGEIGDIIATYSTEEKAESVMKLLIDSQVKFLVLKNIEDVEPDLKEYLKEQQHGVISVKGNELEINSQGNQVFFMPQDNEASV